MSGIETIGRVMVPVADQDAAIAFYTDKLGFILAGDIAYGDGERWVEVAPPGGGAAVALVTSSERFQAGGVTGIGLTTRDARGLQQDLRARDVDVDENVVGGDGAVPLLFFFRDQDANTLLVAEAE